MTVIHDGTPPPDRGGGGGPRQDQQADKNSEGMTPPEVAIEGSQAPSGSTSSFSTKEQGIRVSYVTEPCYGDVKIWLNGWCLSG